MLELKGIYKTFNPGSVNEKRALNGIDLVLEEGDFVTIIGGNGAGKSTMLNAISGAWPIDEGQEDSCFAPLPMAVSAGAASARRQRRTCMMA